MSSSKAGPKLNWSTHPLNPFKQKSHQQAPTENIDNLQSSRVHNAVYYPNWKIYSGIPPSSLNLKFISHIFYAFAWVKEDGLIYLSDEYADTQIDIKGVKGCLNDLRSIKQEHPHIKTIISIGGGGKGSEPFAVVASDVHRRAIFAQSAREVLDTYGLDGIDIDWEHPSDPRQGYNYIQLLAAVRAASPYPNYILTSALPAGEWVLKNIDLGAAANYLDLINLMTYDFSGPWTDSCGHHAQLYPPKHPHNDAARISCSSAVDYVLSKGVISPKIVLGIPTYGRSFLGASKVGDHFTGHGGEEGTFEYRNLPRPGSVVHFDNRVGAVHCIGGDGGFVTYDDPRSVQMKASFVKMKGLGGLFYWTGTADSNDSRSLVETGYKSLCLPLRSLALRYGGQA